MPDSAGRRLLCLGIAALLAGCAAPPRTVADDQAIRSVAVVGLINEQTVLQRIGLTVFNNKSVGIGPTTGLNLAGVEAVETALRASRPGWQIKDARAEIPALVTRMKVASVSGSYAASSESPAELAALVQRLGVDALLVVEDWLTENPPVRGVGVRAQTFSMTSLQDLAAYAVVRVVLIDRNGKRVNVRDGSAFKALTAAYVGLDYDLTAAATPAVQEQLAAAMREQVREASKQAAARLGY